MSKGFIVDIWHNRDYTLISEFWGRVVASKLVPLFVTGDCVKFAPTNLKLIHDLTPLEYESKNPRYKKRNFAIRLGYDGPKFHGFQKQAGTTGILTVQDDLESMLQRIPMAAGRTDKNVSAISQIVSFSTFDDVTALELENKMNAMEPVTSGRLAIFQCMQVPQKFHSLFSATWRRYVYLFPLIPCDTIDVEFVNSAFQRLENKELPYNAFAHQDGLGPEEKLCTLYRAQAKLVNLSDYMHTSGTSNSSTSTDIAGHVLSSPSSSFDHARGNANVVCVELVGSRFLRRMVRLLVATVMTEAAKPLGQRNENILVDIAVRGACQLVPRAVPGHGLAMCGVGYDMPDLSFSKHIKKSVQSPYVAPVCLCKLCRKRARELGSICEESSDCRHSNSLSSCLNNDSSMIDNRTDNDNDNDLIHCSHDMMSTGDNSNSNNNNTTTATNINISPILPVNISPQWTAFQHELAAHDACLLRYPERCFSFNCGDVVLPQSLHDVGTIVWDAEVCLAHFLDTMLTLTNDKASSSFSDTTCSPTVAASASVSVSPISRTMGGKFLELGAGTALAAIVAEKHKCFDQLLVQELETVVEHTKACLATNDCARVQVLASHWNKALVEQCTARQTEHNINNNKDDDIKDPDNSQLCDLVVMADVLYHVEHFSQLLYVIRNTVQPAVGMVIVSVEHRRRDLSSVLAAISDMFEIHEQLDYVVTSDSPRADVPNRITNITIHTFKKLRK